MTQPSGTRSSRSFPRSRSGSSGSTTVEFAVVALPLIAIIGAILEYGVFSLIQTQLQNGAVAAARLIRVSTVNATPIADIQAAICDRVQTIPDCTNKINIELRASDTFELLQNNPTVAANTPALDPITVGPDATTPAYASVIPPVEPGQAGSLIVTYDWAFIFPYMKPFANVPNLTGGRRLYGLILFRKEN